MPLSSRAFQRSAPTAC